MSAPVALSLLLATVTVLLLDWTCVLASAAALSNWLTFTASVAAVPAATLVMALLPALIPAAVTLGPPVMVKPLLFTTVLPAVRLPEEPRLIFSANLMDKVSLPLASTPILSLVS